MDDSCSNTLWLKFDIQGEKADVFSRETANYTQNNISGEDLNIRCTIFRLGGADITRSASRTA